MSESNAIWWTTLCGNDSLYDALWSDNLTWNTDNPDLTWCFQGTVLVFVPAIYIALMTVILQFVFQNQDQQSGNERIGTFVYKSKLILGITICLLLLIAFSKSIYDVAVYKDTALFLVSTLTQLFSFLLSIYLLYLQRRRGCHSSGAQFFFWSIQLITGIIALRTTVLYMQKGMALDTFFLVVFYIYITLVCLRWLLTFFVDKSTSETRERTSSKYADETTPLLGDTSKLHKKELLLEEENQVNPPSPEESSIFLSRVLYIWFYRVLYNGWKKDLKFEDCYDLKTSIKAKTITKAFYADWNKKVYQYLFEQRSNRSISGNMKQKKNTGPSLFLCIMKTLGRSYVYGALNRLFSTVVIFSGPLLLRGLLVYIESDSNQPWKGYFLAVCILVFAEVNTILLQGFLYHCYVFGMKLRSLVTAIVYRKALRLSSAARRKTTVGEIVNLISVDAQKLQEIPSYISSTWSVPITIILSTLLLWQTMGVASLAGLAVIALILPFNGFYVANKVRLLQVKQMRFKDQRIITINEVLAGMKVIKLYAWERYFQNKLTTHRDDELHTIKWVNVLNAIAAVAWNTSAYLVSLAVFGTYLLMSPEHVLNADKIFVTFSLINILNFPMGLLAMSIGLAGQAMVSLERIRRFLLLEEIDDDYVERNEYGDNAVAIADGNFSWGEEDMRILKSINLEIKRGELVAIVGQVGSGKSSLISALLGEMYKQSGTVSINGSIAYVPQQAWIQHNTLKNNILFGKPENPYTYNQVIRHCALEPDLKILPAGDQTEIGEKGINLSGGQKQRVSIARAVYQNEDVYLLDDPLSAVDIHVGKHLFEQVIGPEGVLNQKTRILVTHTITYLPHVDRVIVLRDGQVQESGTYTQLLDANGAFAEFLQTYLEEKETLEENEIEVLKQIKQPDDKEIEEQGYVSLTGSHSGSSISSKYVSLTGSHSGSSLSSKSIRRRLRNRGTLSTGISRKTEEEIPNTKNIITEETSNSGSVSLAVIKEYVKAGGWTWFTLTMIFHLLFLVFMVLTNIWMSEWSSDLPNVKNNITVQPDNIPVRAGVYAGLILGQVITVQIGSVGIAMGCYCASRGLHNTLIQRILRAPMMFFDTTPLGRIMNRCSKDIDTMDVNYPFVIRFWMFNIVPIFSTVIIISYSTPIFLALIVPIAVIYIIIQRIYLKTARQLKRIDAVRRSPVFMHFDETIVGATSIRAYNKQTSFINKCEDLTDNSQKAWYLVLVSYRWLGIAVETLGNLVTFCATALVIAMGSNSSIAGLSVSYSLQMSMYMNFYVRGTSELENYLVSVERIKEYSEIMMEADWDRPDTTPAISWPKEGKVEYRNYYTKYRPGLKPVLKDITCVIQPSEKVGIVGRTGAGKSSMALSLFRIIEATKGAIYIDDLDISTLGLYDLRFRLTVIPQDPVIFCGSLRSNLDPLGVHCDKTIWDSLELTHLKSFVSGVPKQLDYFCGEGGESLSVGQRQLVCLARALLRNSKVLVLDEATSGIDLETDDLIQSTIRSAFKHCTVITIAHRLNTVMDYDRIMVMDQGRIKEFDKPSTLLKDTDSLFYSMAKDARLV